MTCPIHSEVARVQEHLLGALQVAGARDVSTLPPLVRLTRRLLLRELRRYRRAGRFPKNRTHPRTMTPVFVDAEGTRCAMAHLMELGGAASLVATIARERNFARVRELADTPELCAWLEAAGLSVEEGARIQPSYCPDPPASCVCYSSWSSPRRQATAVLEVRVVGSQQIHPVDCSKPDDGRTYEFPRARVEAIHGSTTLVKVGDEISLGASASSASTYLVPLEASSRIVEPSSCDAGVPTVHSAYAIDRGIFDKCDPAFAHPLSTKQIADAMMASNCVAALGAIDPAWSRKPPCDGSESSACAIGSSVGDASSLTLGILVSILGTIAARRRARRSS
jgi:hypothetical protein